jgi:hypothetical protein
MGEQSEVCKNCAYAVLREDKDRKLFHWCSLRCTYNFDAGEDKKLRRVPYKYKHDTCEHFLQADKPHDV